MRAVVDPLLGRAVRLLADEDAVDGCSRLESSRRIDHVAGNEALAGVRTCVDAHERLAGVHGEPHVDGILFDGPLADRQRGTHGALGIVLVDARRSEDGDYGIADELLDGASMALEL